MRNAIKTGCLMLIALLALIPNTYAQILGGFFNQKGTQRKYMIEQIALYKVYLDYVKKGYNITRDGINSVKSIKSGELQLHDNYFRSLKNVNPSVRSQPQVKAILDYCTSTTSTLHTTMNSARQSSACLTSERNCIFEVVSNMDSQIEKMLEELELVITSGKLQLTDDERITRINAVLESARDAYEFSVHFSGDIKLTVLERQRMQREVEKAKKLHQLP